MCICISVVASVYWALGSVTIKNKVNKNYVSTPTSLVQTKVGCKGIHKFRTGGYRDPAQITQVSWVSNSMLRSKKRKRDYSSASKNVPLKKPQELTDDAIPVETEGQTVCSEILGE